MKKVVSEVYIAYDKILKMLKSLAELVLLIWYIIFMKIPVLSSQKCLQNFCSVKKRRNEKFKMVCTIKHKTSAQWKKSCGKQ